MLFHKEEKNKKKHIYTREGDHLVEQTSKADNAFLSPDVFIMSERGVASVNLGTTFLASLDTAIE